MCSYPQSEGVVDAKLSIMRSVDKEIRSRSTSENNVKVTTYGSHMNGCLLILAVDYLVI